MKNDEFYCIGNIANIPNYVGWSVLRAQPESVNTVKQAPASRNLRIRVRTKCANDLAEKYGYTDTDTDVFGQDPLDFEKWAITDHSVVERVADLLGLRLALGRVQVQRAGQMVLPHRDDLSTSYMGEVSEIEHYYRVPITKQDQEQFASDPRSATRVLIMLDDWRIGQGLSTELSIISNWKRGDVFAWDWPTTIHATFNNGYWSRPLLRLSGMITSKWSQLLTSSQTFNLDY